MQQLKPLPCGTRRAGQRRLERPLIKVSHSGIKPSLLLYILKYRVYRKGEEICECLEASKREKRKEKESEAEA